MGKNDGKGDSIYGGVPVPSDADAAIGPAMDNADKYFSNKINGSTDSKDTNYPEQDGKTPS